MYRKYRHAEVRALQTKRANQHLGRHVERPRQVPMECLGDVSPACGQLETLQFARGVANERRGVETHTDAANAISD